MKKVIFQRYIGNGVFKIDRRTFLLEFIEHAFCLQIFPEIENGFVMSDGYLLNGSFHVDEIEEGKCAFLVGKIIFSMPG